MRYNIRLSDECERFGKAVGILEQIGYVEEPDEEKADFVIYNTCTVRENANQRVYGRLGQLGRIKKTNPHMMMLCADV